MHTHQKRLTEKTSTKYQVSLSLHRDGLSPKILKQEISLPSAATALGVSADFASWIHKRTRATPSNLHSQQTAYSSRRVKASGKAEEIGTRTPYKSVSRERTAQARSHVRSRGSKRVFPGGLRPSQTGRGGVFSLVFQDDANTDKRLIFHDGSKSVNLLLRQDKGVRKQRKLKLATRSGVEAPPYQERPGVEQLDGTTR